MSSYSSNSSPMTLSSDKHLKAKPVLDGTAVCMFLFGPEILDKSNNNHNYENNNNYETHLTNLSALGCRHLVVVAIFTKRINKNATSSITVGSRSTKTALQKLGQVKLNIHSRNWVKCW